MSPGSPKAQDATPAEFKAMAHPLRLRILRACLHDSLTNKQIADLLGLDPATTLHHVRTLLRTGFLEAEPVRSGARGALEKPYRATGKSWVLSYSRPDDRLAAVLASLEAARDELVAAGPDSLLTNSRMGLRLSEDDIAELAARLQALAQEYATRPAVRGGTRIGLTITLHRLT